MKVNAAAIWPPAIAFSRLSTRESIRSNVIVVAVSSGGRSLHVKLTEMRLTSILFRNARQPQNEKKVPFKAIMPLKLQNFVSSKGQRLTERGCLYEMSLLLTCLEENEFEDKRCIPQFKALDQCYRIYTDDMQRARSIKEQTTPVPGSKKLAHKQVTYLLQRYPTV